MLFLIYVFFLIIFIMCFCSVTVVLLRCGSFCHENKFLVCVNIPGNKAHSDLWEDLIRFSLYMFSPACSVYKRGRHASFGFICKNHTIKMLWRQDTVLCQAVEKQCLCCLPYDLSIRKQWMNFIFNEDSDRISKDSVLLFTFFFTSDLFTNKAQFDAGFSERLKLKDITMRLYWIWQ